MSRVAKVGETVLYRFAAGTKLGTDASSQAEYRRNMRTVGQSGAVPATVVGVHGTTLNLRVHPDGPGPDLWETSVPMNGTQGEGGACWEFLDAAESAAPEKTTAKPASKKKTASA